MKRMLLFLLAGLLLCPALSASAWDEQNILEEERLPAEAQSVLEDTSYVEAIVEMPYVYLLAENAYDMYLLTVFQQSGNGFAIVAASTPLVAMNGINPSIIAATGSVTILYSEALLYTFQPDTDGVWRLTYVQGEHDYRCTKYWLMEQNTEHSRLLCGADTSPALSNFNPAAFPPDFDDVAEMLDTGNYALVNNPNPADRLNLRTEPTTASDSLGKYYNGTPVQITEYLGDWVKVSVTGTEGYMMKRYLAFGTNMLAVESAFPDLFITPSLYGQDLNVYSRPDTESAPMGVLTDQGNGRIWITVIGIVGDDWVHVICDNDLAGYMPAADFYPGNG